MRIMIVVVLAFLLPLDAGFASAEVVITTDKPTYAVGEIVQITAQNLGPEDEFLVSSPFFVIGNLDTNECLIGCVGLPVVTPFPAGETISMEWDTGLRPDSPGPHQVSVAINDGPSTTYALTAGVPNDEPSWTTLKTRYR